MRRQVLFLDDEPVRHHWADETWSGSIISHVFDIDQFCEALVKNKEMTWDLISLDHDLGISKGNLVNNGMTAVLAMGALETKARNVIIHTINPPAGDRMESDLKRLGYKVYRIPFNTTNDLHWKDE